MCILQSFLKVITNFFIVFHLSTQKIVEIIFPSNLSCEISVPFFSIISVSKSRAYDYFNENIKKYCEYSTISLEVTQISKKRIERCNHATQWHWLMLGSLFLIIQVIHALCGLHNAWNFNSMYRPFSCAFTRLERLLQRLSQQLLLSLICFGYSRVWILLKTCLWRRRLCLPSLIWCLRSWWLPLCWSMHAVRMLRPLSKNGRGFCYILKLCWLMLSRSR